jgi:hypothetical protein
MQAMTNEELDARLLLLSDDLNYFDYIRDNRALFAHYTSIQVLESIIKTEQVWFSSPLLMNDKQEMLHGLDLGTRLFNDSPEITQACGTEPRAAALRAADIRTSFSRRMPSRSMCSAFRNFVATSRMGYSPCGADMEATAMGRPSCSIPA